MFSSSPSAAVRASANSQTMAGMVCIFASLHARSRRSPATSSYPFSIFRTEMGCNNPFSRMLWARPASSRSSKLVRA